MHRFGSVLLIFVFLLVQSGCEQRKQNITNGYGRKSGNDYVDSVNGTAVLAQLFRERGCEVGRSSSITPRINRYQTIVWFRDQFDPPPEKAIEALEDWLDYDYNRRLIVVGRDFDAGLDYWQGVINRSTGKKQVEARRRLARIKSEFHRRRSGRDKEQESCGWYRIDEQSYGKPKTLGGPWANVVSAKNSDVRKGLMLQPKSSRSSTKRLKRQSFETEVLLTADGAPLVSAFTISRSTFENEIILVSNGSFLTNYGLVNKENRKLAIELVDRYRLWGPTLFLESGDRPIQVFDTEPGHETWAWISKPPLKYMVPHFLVLGVFFCFVLFPIFGRPKRLRSKSDSTSFRDHLKAMGKMMSRAGQVNAARQEIDKYADRHRREHDK